MLLAHHRAVSAAAADNTVGLQLAVGALDSSRGDAEVFGQLANRRQPIAGGELATNDEFDDADPDLLVRRDC